MAFVDVNTGTIIGAKPGTLTYYHEEGHIVYNKSEMGMKNNFTKDSLFYFMIFFIVLTFFYPILKWCAFSCMVGNLYYSIYEEAWCWRYAFNTLKLSKE